MHFGKNYVQREYSRNSACKFREVSRYCIAMSTKPITADDVRAALLTRIDTYKAETGKSDSAVGKDAMNDDKWVKRIRAGGSFNLTTYQRVMEWLDAQRAAA